MGLFDDVKKSSNETVEVVFDKLPETLEEFKALKQAAMATPFDTAALTVLALCFYPKDKDLSIEMLNYLKGPNPLSPMEKQFISSLYFMDSIHTQSH